MSGSPKEKLGVGLGHTEDMSEERELYLRDGRKLVVGEQGGDQLVEIRSESGMVEIRIRMTEQGPVLQMESARLSLKGTESVEIESQRVAIKATEQLELSSDRDIKIEAKEQAVMIGLPIHLNPDKP